MNKDPMVITSFTFRNLIKTDISRPGEIITTELKGP